ncbi:MAG: hypothetical protein B7X59_04775 [Polaromonas sp. 39-63-203]|jgi:uncharacterized protein involved in outer membrane biogenesis|uniref:hypothetical protein n=1 Tax=Polaromonas sp. TaxID=1869339 RepID=UPI000BD03E96|nr:hypothetical protein [Polaromonas sp.]OYY53262.1 MAG: hypothetical protein B7Y54_03725 [Polaromonas sp. 35-63-240]OYY99746.1 MAG: hypothetical protein B7Y42_05390 [Polaromonas sp. 28-63-22]OYZ84108.1 MAG: hypothetical protein B7Y03_05530 [Polaromonas sp. 24-62-144]OZA98814.1 MAG: hypothetical protein B7X59_04775 [Polaromonas sp. 39-63-203]HQS30323.1 AsmA-like C-terminal region-containing protein [Polaromonas sp.]
MTRARKWLVGLGAVLGLLLLLALIGLGLLPRDEELARRLADQLSTATGVPVTVGAVQWRVWPSPRVVIENVVTEQPKPITLRKITLRPNLQALWQRRLQLNGVLLEGAVVPHLSVLALGRSARSGPPTLPLQLDAQPLLRFEFSDVTWESRLGMAVVYEGEVAFDAHWRPRTARLVRPGVTPPAALSATRQGQDDRWAVRTTLGGGTANGELRLQTQPSGGLRLSGTLQPQGIDTAAALAAFNRKPVVAGKAAGTTTVSAEGDSPASLARSLHTASSLRISRARLLGFDLEKAVRSTGTEHAGTTPLDTLTLQLDTQNTAQGMVITFSNVKASSGALTATGKARLLNQQIEGEFTVDLVEGLVGVPLKISGPLKAVKVSVPRGAIAGAAVGTAVLPGIGTAIGARIGATLGKIFGAGPDPAPNAKKPPPTPPPSPRQR